MNPEAVLTPKVLTPKANSLPQLNLCNEAEEGTWKYQASANILGEIISKLPVKTNNLDVKYIFKQIYLYISFQLIVKKSFLLFLSLMLSQMSHNL